MKYIENETKYLNIKEQKLFRTLRVSYYNWIKYLTTLSVSILTLSITFQKNYIPQKAHCLYIIQLSWILLIISIASGIITLYGEPSNLFRFIKVIRKLRNKLKDKKAKQLLENKVFRGYYVFTYAKNSLMFCFFSSLLCLMIFAIINIKMINIQK